MIIELILTPLLVAIETLYNLIPDFPSIPVHLTQAFNILRKPLSIFPYSLWVAILFNILTWITIDFTWAIVEWVYKKIPGID